MPRTAINVYSVRALDDTVEGIIERVANAGYDGIQFSGRFTPLEADPDSVAAKLAEVDLDVAPAHVAIEDLEDDLDRVVEAYETVGVDAAVIPLLSSDCFQSMEAVEAAVERVNAVDDELEERGWDLHYHNHDREYVDLGDRLAFDHFIDGTDVGIELDVGWALVGGDDPAERIRSLGDRAELVHMKDMVTSTNGFVEIGDGDVDMQACADAARDVGSEWLIYEHDDPDDPAGTIDHGAEYLRTLR